MRWLFKSTITGAAVVALAIIVGFVALLLFVGAPKAQGPIVGPGQPILCVSAAPFAVGPTTLTTIVAGVAGKAINVCGWHITNTGTTGTFAFSTGTGVNCVTSPTQIVPPQNVTSTAPITDHIDYAFLTIPGGQSLCILPSVATIAAIVYYNQF